MLHYRDFRRPIIVFSCLILLLVGLAPFIVSQFKPQSAEAQTASTCQPRVTGQFAASLVGKVEEIHALVPQRRPIAGATVTVELQQGGQTFNTVADASGQYRINLTLTTNPANARVYISAQDFFARERWILLKSGENSFNPDALISLAGGWEVVFENNSLTEKHSLPPRWVGQVVRNVRKSDPSGNPYDTTEPVNGVTVTVYERLDRGFRTPIASGVSQHRADPIDPNRPGSDGYIEIAKPATYVFGRAYVTKSDNGTNEGEGVGQVNAYSDQLNIKLDRLTVEGMVTQENSSYRIPQARFKITQGKLSYPLEDYGSTNSFDQGSYVYESDYYGYLPITTQRILPLRPGPATIQIFMLKAEGQLDPTPVATKAVTLTSGRNVVDIAVPLVTLCGRLALSEDPALTFPGVPLEFKQRNGEAVQEATTDSNGNFSTAQEVGGSSPSWFGPGYALSFNPSSILKPGYLDATQKFSQAKEADGKEIPPYTIMRDSKTTFQAQSGGGVKTDLKGTAGKSNRIEGRLVPRPGLTVTNQWDLDGFVVVLKRMSDNEEICRTKTYSLVLSGVFNKAYFNFDGENCPDLKKGEYEPYVEVFGPTPLKASNTVKVTLTKNTDQRQYVNLILNQIFSNVRSDLIIQVTETILLDEAADSSSLKDVKVTLSRAQFENGKRKDVELGSKMTDINGRVSFSNLSPALYAWEMNKVGYRPAKNIHERFLTSKILISRIQRLERASLVRHDPLFGCDSKASGTIKFLFCSSVTKALYLQYPKAWIEISAAARRVQAVYPNYKTTPQQIVISSNNTRGGRYHHNGIYGYDRQLEGCPPSLPMSDYYEITAAPVKYHRADPWNLKYVTSHEIGHQIDWHRGNCRWHYSTESKFKEVYMLGEEYGDNFYRVLDTSNYAPVGGYKRASNIEGFASAFELMFLSKNQFQAKAKAAGQAVGGIRGPLLERILLETGRIAAE